MLSRVSLRALAAAFVLLALAPSALAQARLQVIHNSADPAASEVDVYVNGALLLDDFAFRTATPFIDVASGTDLAVAVAPASSTGAGDAVFTETFNLPAGSTTQLIASGVLTPGSFAANPDGASTAFQLLVGADAQEAGPNPNRVAVRVVHGATDAPTVDVRSDRGINTKGVVRVDDASYGAVTGYVRSPERSTPVFITLADGTPVAGFQADLTGAGGGALTVLASGFLNPAANQDGEAFGLLAVFPDGSTALLPPAAARLQVIHNSADPAASEVDVYVNGALLLDDFAFRTATPFIDVASGTDLAVAVAPASSTGAGDAVFTETFNLPAGSTTQLIASGVLTPGSFAANPDGASTAFQLLVGASAQEAGSGAKVSVRGVHGATDAPTVDIRSGGAVLIDDAGYTDVTGYLRLAPGPATLDVTTADGSPVASFVADLTGTSGAAVTVLASGFLSPDDDQDGPAFGLLAVFPNGAAALLPAAPTRPEKLEAEKPNALTTTASGAASFATAVAFGLDAPYPNPASGAATVSFGLAEGGAARVAVYDALGREVAVVAEGTYEAGRHTASLAAGMPAGVYVVRLEAEGQSQTQRLTIVR